MRFGLQDVKKQVRRREGESVVTLHFLRSGELHAEIERLIVYYEQHCGQVRKQFAQDEASALVGDYRMANCLQATLSAWYAWRQPVWEDSLQRLSDDARAALEAAALNSPVSLRLALFDYVNAHHAGFVGAQQRATVLATFAALYHLDSAALEYLLALDTDDEAVLARVSVQPHPPEVAALYNQWVFEAALFNSSEVRFTIDCEAFLELQRTGTAETLTGIGAVIKRLCYLARKLGVYYDLAYENTLPGTHGTLLHLTLYGPQEMTGNPQQYGQRLAHLCRVLLGYNTMSSSAHPRRQTGVLLKAVLRTEATVHILQNACRFTMDATLLALLPSPEQEREAGRVAEAPSMYDSSIEQSFAEAFTALERSQGTDGWQLEREPEPLLLAPAKGEISAPGIFIPDFALTRGARRIYIEILGFWTPAYRERKIQKLQQLRGQVDLVLAFPYEARQAFAGLASDYPLIEYRDQFSPTDLLRVMRERYDDFEERLASLDREDIRTRVRAAKFVPERACYRLLHCYRRSELAKAAAHVLVPDEIAYTPGLGLYMLAWLEHLHHSFVVWIEAKKQSELAVSVVLQEWKAMCPELTACEDTVIETFLDLWPEVQIRRSTIFEAILVVEAARDMEAEECEQALFVRERPPKAGRERNVGSKKRAQQGTSQQNLWE